MPTQTSVDEQGPSRRDLCPHAVELADRAPAPSGLSAAAAAQRLAAEGPNTLPGGSRRSGLKIAAETLREPMFLLLLSAGALYLVWGDLWEGLTLFGFVVFTVGLTLYQEGKTERAIDALRELTSPRAMVVRDGQAQRVAGRDVVRGDLLKLSEGDRVPADALLCAAQGILVDESLLTGESAPVGKRVASPQERLAAFGAAADGRFTGRPGGDDQPLIYAGTLIVQGTALAEVTATGPRSQIGQIGLALGTLDPERSPLHRQTDRLVRRLALLALALSLCLVLAHGLVRGDWLQAWLAGIALAMSLLPEEYPVVLTVFPALGAHRLSKQGVLTRRISAIETLGATSVLCVDKTGTLTENRMTLTHLVSGGPRLEHQWTDAGSSSAQGIPLPEAFHPLLEIALLASAPDPVDPMEQAIHRLGQRLLANTEHLHRDWRLVHRYALSPELRAMSHVWAAAGEPDHVVAAKGAPEAVMDLCHLNDADRQRIGREVDDLACQGLRVIAVARGVFAGQDWPSHEHALDVEFVGLLGLADPVRAEVPAAVAECRAAGIRVVMITGDYPATARAIARSTGWGHADGDVLTGEQIDHLSDEDLSERMSTVSLCARIAPAQKLRIVQALKARGEVVAMTGDGVNDAPALRAAHVGVAMGARGTDVAREAASLVLVNDDFAALVRAVRLGRRIFDNLRKAMAYVLAVHVPIAGLALLPLLLGWPVLLHPVHIALLELLIDPACSMAFENEPEEPDLMRRPPRDVQGALFGGAPLWNALVQGLGVLVIALASFAWARTQMSEPQARAFVFTTLVSCNLALILANRSPLASVWTAWRRPNRTLWWIVGATLALTLAALYTPWTLKVLRFEPLPAQALAAAIALGGLGLLWFEGLRALRRARSVPEAGMPGP